MQAIIVNWQKAASAKTMPSALLSTQAEREGRGPVYLLRHRPAANLDEITQPARGRDSAARGNAVRRHLVRTRQAARARCGQLHRERSTAPLRRSAITAGKSCHRTGEAQSLRQWSAAATFQWLNAEHIPFDDNQGESQHYISSGCSYLYGRNRLCRLNDYGRTAQEISALWKNINSFLPAIVGKKELAIPKTANLDISLYAPALIPPSDTASRIVREPGSTPE